MKSEARCLIGASRMIDLVITPIPVFSGNPTERICLVTAWLMFFTFDPCTNRHIEHNEIIEKNVNENLKLSLKENLN